MRELGYLYYTSNRPDWKSKILATLRSWRARRAAILEIKALPDRILRDIGLERAHIDAKVTALMEKQDSQAIAGPHRAGVPAGSFGTAACC